MPIDVAEWVLNRCVLEGHRLRTSKKDVISNSAFANDSDGIDGPEDVDGSGPEDYDTFPLGYLAFY